LSSRNISLFRKILVAIALLCFGSIAFTAPTTSTSDNPKALLRHGPLQKRAPTCEDPYLPRPDVNNCTIAIRAMPFAMDEGVVGQFGGALSDVMIGSPFRLPRFFPYKDCMVEVDMESRDIVADHSSWNEIAQKAINIVKTCVEGEYYKSGGREMAGYRSAIEVKVSWNFPELNMLASLNRPLMEEAMARQPLMGPPPTRPLMGPPPPRPGPVLRMPL